ncbi:MAG: hypothetical protein SFX73_14125 [Kofleriaceae bacterium]|nr:hypothetical protein [Kofleriaceae bacterium]
MKPASNRLDELLSPAAKAQATALWAQVVALRAKNAEETLIASDIWCVFLDENDAKAWCQLYGTTLARKLDPL